MEPMQRTCGKPRRGRALRVHRGRSPGRCPGLRCTDDCQERAQGIAIPFSLTVGMSAPGVVSVPVDLEGSRFPQALRLVRALRENDN